MRLPDIGPGRGRSYLPGRAVLVIIVAVVWAIFHRAYWSIPLVIAAVSAAFALWRAVALLTWIVEHLSATAEEEEDHHAA